MSVDFEVKAISYEELLEAFKEGTQIDFVRDEDLNFIQAEIANATPIEGGVKVVMSWAIQHISGKSTI